MLSDTRESLPRDIYTQMELAAELTTYRSLHKTIVRDLDAALARYVRRIILPTRPFRSGRMMR